MKRTITTILAIILLTLTAASALVSCQNVTPDGGDGGTTPADDPDAGKPEWSGLTVGKDADLCLWDGNPLEISSSVIKTLIDGQVVWEKKEG